MGMLNKKEKIVEKVAKKQKEYSDTESFKQIIIESNLPEGKMRDRIIEKYKLDSRYNHQLIPKISKL